MLDTTPAATAPATSKPTLATLCTHSPACPAPTDPTAATARVRVDHSEQGWELLCNGVIRFDDAGTHLTPA